MADTRRLVEAAIVPPLAQELAAQITAGVGNRMRLVETGMVPRQAAEVAAQIGGTASATRLVELGFTPIAAREIAAQIGGGGGLPTLTLTGPLAFTVGAAAGTLIANIGNVPTGATPTVAPNDGRFAIAGDAGAGWKVVVGLSASSAGTVNITVNAAGAQPAMVPVVVSAAAGFDYTVATDQQMADTFALGGATLSGKRIGVQPGTYTTPLVNITGNAQPIVVASANPANPARIERMTLKRISGIRFEDMLFTSAEWPASQAASFKPAVAYSPGSGETVENVDFLRCTTRGNYRGSVADNALPDPLAVLPEYASLLTQFNGTGGISSVTLQNTFVGDLLTDGTYPLTFSNTDAISFTTFPTGWTMTVASGIITAVTPGTAGASNQTGALNASTGIMSKSITWPGQRRAIEFFAFGHQALNASGTIGALTYRDGAFKNLNNAFKVSPTNGAPVIIDRNDFDNIYQDYVSIGMAKIPAPGAPTVPPPLYFRFNRGQGQLSKSGDPGDPHGDWIQTYMNDLGIPAEFTNVDWYIELVGNVQWADGRQGPQQLISEVPENGVAYTGKVVGNLHASKGLTRGLSIDRIKNMLIYRNVTIGYNTADSGNGTMATTFGTAAVYTPLGHNAIGGNIGDAFTIQTGGTGKITQGVPNVTLGSLGLALPYTTVMPAWVNSPTTFAEAQARMQSASGYSYAGAYDPAGYIDYVNRTIDLTKEWPGVEFVNIVGQAANTKVWSGYWRVAGGPAAVPYSVPAGVSMMVADDDAGTNAGAEIVGPAAGTVPKGKFVRAAVTTSATGSTTVSGTITLNGFPTVFSARTAAVLSYATADNQTTARSAAASPISTDTGIAKVLMAVRFRADSIVVNGEIAANPGGTGFRMYHASNAANGLRFLLGTSGIISVRDAAVPAVGAMQTHLFAIDLTKTAQDEVLVWMKDSARTVIGTSPTVNSSGGTTRLNMASVLINGLGILSRPDGTTTMDGAIDMFYMDWGDANYVLPDITTSAVQDKFTRDLIANGTGPTGSTPKLCYFGPVGASDGSTSDTWNATGGLVNKGSIASKPLIKQAGTYA